MALEDGYVFFVVCHVVDVGFGGGGHIGINGGRSVDGIVRCIIVLAPQQSLGYGDKLVN